MSESKRAPEQIFILKVTAQDIAMISAGIHELKAKLAFPFLQQLNAQLAPQVQQAANDNIKPLTDEEVYAEAQKLVSGVASQKVGKPVFGDAAS